ncbi:7659_t:CDS:1, partial [Scutellospora calospora]
EISIKKANITNSNKQEKMKSVESYNINKEEREKHARIELEKIERKRGELREGQNEI